MVEDGEECDCGWEEDCRDQCCFPMRRVPPIDEPPCTLTPRSICSPSQVGFSQFTGSCIIAYKHQSGCLTVAFPDLSETAFSHFCVCYRDLVVLWIVRLNSATSVETITDVEMKAFATAKTHIVLHPLINQTKPFAIRNSFVSWG